MPDRELPPWYDRSDLDAWLRDRDKQQFADHVQAVAAQRLNQPTNGDLKRWVAALEGLPAAKDGMLDWTTEQVRLTGPSVDSDALRQTLMTFHPWRKGPFNVFGTPIDTEWRSDWKWDRVKDCVDWRYKSVLDVGCGNGYFGWRMLQAGAAVVMGMDPILRYIMQFEVFHRYAGNHVVDPQSVIPQIGHFVVPMLDTDLPEKLHLFDIAFSAGVLYHRTSPIDHLRTMADALVPGGKLILETLVVDDPNAKAFVPEDRYAQMRNVWFLPSLSMLQLWLRRTGFEDVQTVDVTPTTVEEQRSTDWMTFQSLKDFLDPNDPSKTIEGYPGPLRATLTASRA